ncbi:Lipoprotein-releasing system ATP-binding protein LolD [Cedecea neteri]|uniref:Lipoprotein-releasing system ATP-binding protein LolD n=1 Tax=Cedecea neteri TaxID=158822 RepID=A0A2X2SY24_9ENTR|nr:Lipoprotein-releasing system ATP-binding protein LolD [Cedecea neteri]
MLAVRRQTIGWVSQFLRVIPRISALEVVMQPLLDLGVPREECEAKAASLLTRPQRPGAPVAPGPVDLLRRRAAARKTSPAALLLITPFYCWMSPPPRWTPKNSAAVVALIQEAKARGAAIVGIFHDEAVREQVADRLHTMSAMEPQHDYQ